MTTAHDHSYDRIAASPAKTKELQGLVEEVARRRMTRRHFLERAAALGLGASGIATILAACGASDTPDSTPTTIDTSVKPEQIIRFFTRTAVSKKRLKESQKGMVSMSFTTPLGATHSKQA